MMNMSRGRMITSGDSPNQNFARAFDMLHAPVSFVVFGLEKVFGLDEGTSVGIWLVLLFAYWMTIGALIGWGVSAVKSKVLGE
jgi:hypothetical protein